MLFDFRLMPAVYIRQNYYLKVLGMYVKIYRMSDIYIILVGLVPYILAGLASGFILLIFQWVLGKDKRPDVVKVEYKLPHDIPSYIAGVLIDEKADVIDIISIVFDLGSRGYIDIVPVERNKMFMDDKEKDVILKVKKKDFSELNEIEADVIDFILEQTDLNGQVFLSDFGPKFGRDIILLEKKVEDDATKRGFFNEAPYSVRDLFTALSIILFIGSIFGIYLLHRIYPASLIKTYSPQFTFTNPLFPVFHSVGEIIILGVGMFILGGIIYFVYGKLKDSVALRTDKGVEAWGRLLGFREFIKRVEKDRIKKLALADPDIFTKVLPYAMVLGVAKEWIGKMEKEYVNFPAWFDTLSQAEKFWVINRRASLGAVLVDDFDKSDWDNVDSSNF